MKSQVFKLLILIVTLFSVLCTAAQTTGKKPVTKSKTSKSKSSTSSSVVKSPTVAVTVKLTSKCEKNVMIYAGPKDNLRDPKQRELGGLSVNMLYLKTGDVVCIMDAKKNPISCINVTKATTQLEINFAGTAVATP